MISLQSAGLNLAERWNSSVHAAQGIEYSSPDSRHLFAMQFPITSPSVPRRRPVTHGLASDNDPLFVTSRASHSAHATKGRASSSPSNRRATVSATCCPTSSASCPRLIAANTSACTDGSAPRRSRASRSRASVSCHRSHLYAVLHLDAKHDVKSARNKLG